MIIAVVVAEWLRRLTRNQMGSSRTGSNPVHDDFYFQYFVILSHYYKYVIIIIQCLMLSLNFFFLTISFATEKSK